MNIIEDLGTKAQKLIWGIVIKKGVKSAAKLVVSYAVANGIRVSASYGGIAFDSTDVAGMTLALNAAAESLRNVLKTKWPEKFRFL